ncbi:MAG: hypothetical protein ACKO6Q_06880 [Bacteroidota bacterium]
MKKIYFLLAMFVQTLSLVAQSNSVDLKHVFQLEIPREGGANGASVAWHPIEKKYYAAMAGNISFCMGVFDVKGKLLSSPELETMFDVRGLWYNPSRKTLQMNGYNDFGWGEYKLNSKGLPTSVKILREGMNQPYDQSAGAFNPKGNVIYFLNETGEVEIYDAASGSYREKLELKLGYKKDDAIDDDDYEQIFNDEYNTTSIVYTGIKGAELGLLNTLFNVIELYDVQSGYMTSILTLPDGAQSIEWLNFAYTNGIYFLFDKDARIWHGYK